MTTLLDKIENRTAIIGIVGLGYVGLPLAVVFAEAGFRVKGIDGDAKKVDAVKRQESYIEDISPAPHYLITAGAGFIGSHSAEALLTGHKSVTENH